MIEPRVSGRGLLAAAVLFAVFAAPAVSAPPAELDIVEEEVTVQVPIVTGRQDQALRHARERAFRQAILASLRRRSPAEQSARDFRRWQEMILSHAEDYIFSYRILSEESKKGFLTLTVQTGIYGDKLEEALRAAAPLSPALPVRVLVLAEAFPLPGAYGGGREEVDGGRMAAAALEAALSRAGAVIMAPPGELPWERAGGSASDENRVALAADLGRRTGTDYVLIAQLSLSHENLLSLSTQLVSAAAQSVIYSTRVAVELIADTTPEEIFRLPAKRLSARITPRLKHRRQAGGRKGASP